MKNRNTYQPILLLIFSTLLLLPFFPGCKKEPLPPPVVEPEELAPTLELTVTPEGVVPYGEERVVLGWTTTNATQVIVNDQRQVAVKSGTHTIPERIFKDTTFHVQAINVKKMTKKSITIPVGDWTTSTFGLVSYFPWRYKTQRLRSLDGKILGYLYLDDEEKSWIIYYHKDGTITYSNYPGLKIPWSLPDDNSITRNGTTRKLQVNQEQMIISYQTMYNGDLIWFDMVFEHASDTPTDPE